MPDTFLAHLKDRILIVDGAMGTSVHARDLSIDSDYQGHENCAEILADTRPDVIEDIHASFLSVGADCIETDTFGGSKLTLAEFGLQDRTYELNQKAAQIGRRCADRFSTPAKPRFVFGSMGPGTKLPSLGHATFDDVEDGYAEQARGLLDGGSDALVVETCQDILQAKAAICGATLAMHATSREVPLIVTITIEVTGTMLVGTEIAAALTALEAYPQVKVIGLNCATGPQEMSEHVRHLGRHCDRHLAVLPNAGLPQIVHGRAHYALTPAELAKWLKEFIVADGVNIVGGCCGTTPEHIAAVADAVDGLKPMRRTPDRQPTVSSLYHAVDLKQDSSFLIVGERSNTNGSRKFKRLLKKDDLDGLVEMGREQVREGSHVLDLCVDFVGRDGVADMQRIAARFAQDVTAPLMLDSTESEVIEAGLKLAGGKCIVNSVNLEDGEDKLRGICPLLKKYAAAVVALTIDEDPEEAMAKTADRKLTIATRLHDLLTGKYGIDAGDILFDCLTFPITTGSEADRRLALETLDGIERVMRAFPDCGTILGVSNVSFGLAPAARVVLNSVFLSEALDRGLTAAIVHSSKVLPRNKISESRWNAALHLIHDRHTDGHDPLTHFISLFGDEEVKPEIAPDVDVPAGERLKRRIIDGRRTGIDEDLEEAMRHNTPLEIVNTFLLDGMKVVGELFGSGKMQLPFVLSSAETMKTAVAYLEPHMHRLDDNTTRGTMVLATVKGDVHDIGKNLVDIILSNNGYTVHNLGIKQPIGNVIEAVRKYGADAIGLSGLLVKSTLVMRDDLKTLNESGVQTPVILGGAALTRPFVENDLRPTYNGELAYAKDAFEGLELMNKRAEGLPWVEVPPVAAPRKAVVAVASAADIPPRSDIATDNPIPVPPFWGERVIEAIPLKSVYAYLNEVMLFQVQWHYRKARRAAEEYAAYIRREVRPILDAWMEKCTIEKILRPQAVYGYWPCNSEGDDLVVYDAPAATGPIDATTFERREIQRFTFPRQDRKPYWCLSDFWRPVDSGAIDVVALHIVTIGHEATRRAGQLFRNDRYRDYLHLHGLSVETTEALAEFMHKQIRMELAIAGNDARDVKKLFKQGYQGSRYSFGYPACPALEDQAKLWPLLRPDRIRIKLSEEFQLEPEQSTSAIVAHHPEARYFNVRDARTDPTIAARIGAAP